MNSTPACTTGKSRANTASTTVKRRRRHRAGCGKYLKTGIEERGMELVAGAGRQFFGLADLELIDQAMQVASRDAQHSRALRFMPIAFPQRPDDLPAKPAVGESKRPSCPI